MRENAVAYIQRQKGISSPFFLYVPFQEAHSPDQVDQKYKDLYPALQSTPQNQALAGMITHTDEMVGDIVAALNASGLYENTIIVFSSDNGGPGGQDMLIPRPQRFDPNYLDRNWPFRGQKHELYEGGVHVAGFVHSPLLPASVRGTTLQELFHVTDWLPTLLSITGTKATRKHQPFDGHDMWGCIQGDTSLCSRKDVVLNINTVCDDPGAGSTDFKTECPAPKAAMRVGDLKVLAECFDSASLSFKGRMSLYNITADRSEAHDLASQQPAALKELSARLLSYAKEASMVPPLEDSAPWQGPGYYCSECTPGRPQGWRRSWEVWWKGPAGQVC